MDETIIVNYISEQKLKQCEELVIKAEDIYSLEDLRFLPNLHSLVIDYSWRIDSRIEDWMYPVHYVPHRF